MRSIRATLLLLAAAALTACSSDSTGGTGDNVTAGGVWTAGSLGGFQYFDPRMTLNDASGALSGTMTATFGGGGGAGPLPAGAEVHGTRQSSAVTLTMTFDPSVVYTFTGTLSGSTLSGTVTDGAHSSAVVFHR